MALYPTNDFGFDAPLTVQHLGTPVVKRVVLAFPSAKVLAANDVFLIGQLPSGYVLDSIQVDVVDTVANAVLDIGILNEAQNAVAYKAISDGSLTDAGFVKSNSAEALRHGRFEGTQTIGAVVTTGGNVAAGTEIGFMLIYRNAQTDE